MNVDEACDRELLPFWGQFPDLPLFNQNLNVDEACDRELLPFWDN